MPLNSFSFDHFFSQFSLLEKVSDSIQKIPFKYNQMSLREFNTAIVYAQWKRNKSNHRAKYFINGKLVEDNNYGISNITSSGICNGEDFYSKVIPVGKIIYPNFILVIIKEILWEESFYQAYTFKKDGMLMSTLELYSYYSDAEHCVDLPLYVNAKSKWNNNNIIDWVKYGWYDIKQMNRKYRLREDGYFEVISEKKIFEK
jgi:hypothetical protein